MTIHYHQGVTSSTPSTRSQFTVSHKYYTRRRRSSDCRVTSCKRPLDVPSPRSSLTRPLLVIVRISASRPADIWQSLTVQIAAAVSVQRHVQHRRPLPGRLGARPSSSAVSSNSGGGTIAQPEPGIIFRPSTNWLTQRVAKKQPNGGTRRRERTGLLERQTLMQ